MNPDFDVCVIGSGPAGISTAIRARWVKRHYAVPCKVALVDPAPLGGLAAMGSTVLTGLNFQMSAEVILDKLLGDVRDLSIPHIRERVERVEAEPGAVRIELASGRTLSSRAAVIACGMRMLGREAALWGRGVTGLSMGVDHVVATLQRLATGDHKTIVFVGSEKVLALRPILDAARRDNRTFHFVIEPVAGAADVKAPEGAIVGHVDALEGADSLRAVRVRRPDGSLLLLDPVDLLVMDFLSLEGRPARSLEAPELELDENGFIRVDRRCRTNLPGIFAAGDATGMPACVAKAMGEGIVAGFEAYRYVYHQKFGTEPQLFAYYPWDGDLREFPGELPPIPSSGLRLELIVPKDEVFKFLTAHGISPELIPTLLDGLPAEIEAIAARTDVAIHRIAEIARLLVMHKVATIR